MHVVTPSGRKCCEHKGSGLVSDVFSATTMSKLEGVLARMPAAVCTHPRSTKLLTCMSYILAHIQHSHSHPFACVLPSARTGCHKRLGMGQAMQPLHQNDQL